MPSTNLLAPNGLEFSRNFISGSNTYQANKFKIKAGYGSNIGIGDLVVTGTSTNQGYLALATTSSANILGVFVGVLPYYDQTAMQTMHGLNGAYQSSANPLGDIDCLVISDPFATFRAQVSAASAVYAESWRGQNITFVNASNGAPNSAGRSTLVLDYTTLNTTSSLAFRIVGPVGVTGGPQDPANYNPWIEVKLNTSELLTGTGI
jgi:hypothetical protein